MDIRYSANQRDFRRWTTEEIRKEFLVENLYRPDEVVAVYSHVDRMVIFGCMPVTSAVPLDRGIEVMKNFGTTYVLERRELGLFNLGGDGVVHVDDETFELARGDCLYVAQGSRSVAFSSKDGAKPAKFYMVSAPAHRRAKTTFIPISGAKKKPLGAVETANKRVINQFIHPDVLDTCQLSMGLTVLDPGSVWNTMPAHTHERRMEIYTYFDIPAGQVVFHMMGEPTETRHIVVREGDAVISPSWSIHAGVGTGSYAFIWAMGGENQTFDDMDHVATPDLR